MAWHGEAQTDLMPVELWVKILRFGQVVVEFNRQFDFTNIGAQMKLDILEDPDRPIPQEMRNRPGECLLVLSLDGTRVLLQDYDRLLKHQQSLSGVRATLEVLEPGANIENEPMNLQDFNVHPRIGEPQPSA